MKVYRGPSSKPFWHETHELVSRVSPKQLEEGVRSKALIRFNITKDGLERQAVCTAHFEEADLIPMIGGLLSRLSSQQQNLAKIREVIASKEMTNNQKISEIQKVLQAN